MKVFIQARADGSPFNVNAYIAEEGFEALGWQVHRYRSIEDVDDPDPAAVIVGGIGMVRKRLALIGRERTGLEIDYPEVLDTFLGRRIWTSTVEELVGQPEKWNVFIKPTEETKKFAGRIVRELKDFIGIVDHAMPTTIWCSDVVCFRSEWRCFIRYGKVLDVRRYKGAMDTRFDLTVLDRAIAAFSGAPAAYAMDFGLDDHDRLLLVEVNDGHSLGTYGIGSVNYAKFLSARWAELAGTVDHANF